MKNNLNQILKEIIKDTDIPNIPISGISTNSVNISPGELYINNGLNKVCPGLSATDIAAARAN